MLHTALCNLQTAWACFYFLPLFCLTNRYQMWTFPFSSLLLLSLLSAAVSSSSFYDNPDQDPLPNPKVSPQSSEELHRKWDAEVSVDSRHKLFSHMKRIMINPGMMLTDRIDWHNIQWGFQGISTFAHLKHVKCLVEGETTFDIGILGVPFDTATTYRPGEWSYTCTCCVSVLYARTE